MPNKLNFNRWREFLNESKAPAPPVIKGAPSDRVLREVTQDEMAHIERALEEMEPEDLAFNGAFDGKNRLIIDFKTLDTDSETGRFMDMLDRWGYTIDWQKGMLSATKELKDGSTENMAAQILDQGGKKPRPRKIQMKLGKFWGKVHDLASKRNALFRKIKSVNDNERARQAPADWTDHRELHPGSVTGTMIEAALGGDEQKRYQQLADLLEMYTDFNHAKSLTRDPSPAQKWQEFWQKNAEYLKNNHDEVMGNKFSIIITRHPVDVLRMSDFDNITSCHSPPSRGGEGQYYKCAVAEAHGHGAVAYVVDTEELIEAYSADDIEEVEAARIFQEDEVFTDDQRGSYFENVAGIEAISRVRLRQVRYYEATQTGVPKTDDYKKAGRNPFDGVQLAVPEQRVYGKKIPGIRKRIMTWAKEAQQEQMNIVKRDTDNPDSSERVLQLDKFIKFGGSYEDNHISALIADLFSEGGLPANVGGTVARDTETEDQLESNLILGLLDQWEHEVEEIAERFNSNYAACEVEGDVEDDGGGGAYIRIGAVLRLDFPREDFAKYPSWDFNWEHVAAEIHDAGYGFLDYHRARAESHGFGIRLIIPIEPEYLPDFGGQGYAYEPDMFEEFCQEIDKIDNFENDYSLFSKIVIIALKREGLYSGGFFQDWARNIEHGDTDIIRWEETAIEDDEVMGDYQEIQIGTDVEVQLSSEDLGQIHWKPEQNQRQAWVGNTLFARIWQREEGNFELESEYATTAEGYYDTFAQAKNQVDIAFETGEAAYDIAKKILHSHDYSVALKTAMGSQAMATVGSDMWPSNWSLDDIAFDDGAATFMIRMWIGSDDPEDAVKTAHELYNLWDDTEEINKAAQQVYETMKAQLNEQIRRKRVPTQTKKFVSAWKEYLNS